MQINSFKEMYVSELQEARSLEAQLTSALPEMIEKTDDADLKQALQDHLSETQTTWNGWVRSSSVMVPRRKIIRISPWCGSCQKPRSGPR